PRRRRQAGRPTPPTSGLVRSWLAGMTLGGLLRRHPVAAAHRRRRDGVMVAALPDVLERVAGSLRAGAAPLVALADAAESAALPGALAGDLRRIIERADENGLQSALAAWAEERPIPAVGAVAAALEIT